MLIWKLSDNDIISVFWGEGSYTNLHKIRSRQLRDLKLGGMIAYIRFAKLEIFKSHDDAIILSFVNLSIKRAKDNLQH